MTTPKVFEYLTELVNNDIEGREEQIREGYVEEQPVLDLAREVLLKLKKEDLS